MKQKLNTIDMGMQYIDDKRFDVLERALTIFLRGFDESLSVKILTTVDEAGKKNKTYDADGNRIPNKTNERLVFELWRNNEST